MKKARSLVRLVILSIVGLVLPVITLAQTVPTTSSGKFGEDLLKQTNLPNQTPNQFVVNIINAATGLLAVVLIGMLVYGGALYLTSAGNEQRVEAGKTTITYAIIGVVIVAAARIIAEFVIKSVTQ